MNWLMGMPPTVTELRTRIANAKLYLASNGMAPVQPIELPGGARILRISDPNGVTISFVVDAL